MIDWDRKREILIDASRSAFAAFLSEARRAELCAVGCVFELWQSPCLHLCANTRHYYRQQLAMYRVRYPDLAEDEIRWNSGDYEFPANLLDDDELGAVWNAEMERLYRLGIADADLELPVEHAHGSSVEVYSGLVRISCETLAMLAREGLFGDWRRIDFNVSDVSDEEALVRERDRWIREMIAAT